MYSCPSCKSKSVGIFRKLLFSDIDPIQCSSCNQYISVAPNPWWHIAVDLFIIVLIFVVAAFYFSEQIGGIWLGLVVLAGIGVITFLELQLPLRVVGKPTLAKQLKVLITFLFVIGVISLLEFFYGI